MNCFSRFAIASLGIALLAACGAPASESTGRPQSLEYKMTYSLAPDPASGTVTVELQVAQERHLLRQMRFDAGAVSLIAGDGISTNPDGSVVWNVPTGGGRLAWSTVVANRRNGDGYDAYLGGTWGLFRAEDVVPRAATRTLRGAYSATTMRFDLPRGWSAVTEYREESGRFRVNNDERRFDQPRGWIVVGELGVRRDRIAGIRVAVAGPSGAGVRRLDMLALLNWTLPELDRIAPQRIERLTIVSAGDPMWRGGLSAPRSIFLHSDRPLISENGTSTLLHEVVHMAFGIRSKPGYDWIAEGFAEYYSLELLGRSGTLSPTRLAAAMQFQTDWAQEAGQLCGDPSTGPKTAFAVIVFDALDAEIRAASDGEHTLDDVVAALASDDSLVDLQLLTDAAADLIEEKPESLDIDSLPGCLTIADIEAGDR